MNFQPLLRLFIASSLLGHLAMGENPVAPAAEKDPAVKPAGSAVTVGERVIEPETPAGIYFRRVKAAIDEQWILQTKELRHELTPGTAKVVFVITRSGAVDDVRLATNTSNDVFGQACLRCVKETRIPAPPEELRPTMEDGKLHQSMTFTSVPAGHADEPRATPVSQTTPPPAGDQLKKIAGTRFRSFETTSSSAPARPIQVRREPNSVQQAYEHYLLRSGKK